MVMKLFSHYMKLHTSLFLPHQQNWWHLMSWNSPWNPIETGLMGSSRISSTDVQSHHWIYHAHYIHPMRIIVLYHYTISFHSVLYMDCGVEYWIGFKNYCRVLSGDVQQWQRLNKLAAGHVWWYSSVSNFILVRQRSAWEFIRCAVPGHPVCAGRNWLVIHGWNENTL